MVVLKLPEERGPRSTNSTFVVLGKHSQTETGFKTNFLPMKGENSITFYCIVLALKSAKIWSLVKEILASEALGIMDYDSEHKVDDLDNGWVLDSE